MSSSFFNVFVSPYLSGYGRVVSERAQGSSWLTVARKANDAAHSMLCDVRIRAQSCLPELNVEMQNLVVSGLIRDFTVDICGCVLCEAKEICTDRVRDIVENLRKNALSDIEIQDPEKVLTAVGFWMKVGIPTEGETVKRIFTVNHLLSTDDAQLIMKKVFSVYQNTAVFIAPSDDSVTVSSEDLKKMGRIIYVPKKFIKDLKTSVIDVSKASLILEKLRASQPVRPKAQPAPLPAPVSKPLLDVQAKAKELINPPPKSTAWVNVLSDLCRDYTERAELGLIAPIYCRDEEIQSVFDGFNGNALSSVLLYGPPGSGKTKIAEGIALKIAKGDVPDEFKGRRVLFVNCVDLVGGTTYRGDMEGRVKRLMNAAESHASEVILVFDEIAQSAGRFGSESSPTIADLLKPYIDRTTFPLLAMTTEEEYQKMVTTNSAYTRRFKQQKFARLSPKTAIEVLEFDKERLEKLLSKKDRKISINSSALEALTYLSLEFIKNEGLPSSAYKLFDNVSIPAVRKGVTEISEQVVVDYIARTESMDEGSVRAKLEQLKTAPTVQVVDPSSLLYRFSYRMSVAPVHAIVRPELTSKILEGLKKAEYKAVFVKGGVRAGKTTLIQNALRASPSERVALQLHLNDLQAEVASNKIKLRDFIGEIERKAEKLTLILSGKFFADSFGKRFIDEIQSLVESGKLELIVEVHDDRHIPAFWQERSTLVVVPHSREVTDVKVAEMRPKMHVKKPSYLSLFFNKITWFPSKAFSTITSLFSRFFSIFR